MLQFSDNDDNRSPFDINDYSNSKNTSGPTDINSVPPDAIPDFLGRGLIASFVPLSHPSSNESKAFADAERVDQYNKELDAPYVLAGYWNLDVQDGEIENFEVNFSMVRINGTRFHTHEITNFEPNVVIPVVLDPQQGTTFTGMTHFF